MTAFAAAEELVHDVEIEASTGACLELALEGSVSAYDAEFVLVAEQMDLTLVTADRRLARAFQGRAIYVEEFAAE